MLSYEKIAFEDYSLRRCESVDLKMLIESNMSSIDFFSKKTGIDKREIIRQIRLHAPQFNINPYDKSLITDKIFPILQNLLKNYVRDFTYYREQCGANILFKHKKCLSIMKKADEPVIVLTQNKGLQQSIVKNEENKIEIIANLRIDVVSDEIGEFIETNLHYLRSYRSDACLKIGLFIEGYTFPICYMSFSLIDRSDKIKALRKSLNINIKNESVIELSRVFGCGDLPRNAISFMVANARKYIKNYKYLITAVNLNLGFSGSSMIGSGFVPYALRPVKYAYNSKGFYTTYRKQEVGLTYPAEKMPPNVLYVREIDCQFGAEKNYCNLIIIKNKRLSKVGAAIEPEISEIRKKLEKVWNKKTCYHGTKFSQDQRVSKGQCGVSSLHLALKLKRRGYSVFFCEGDLRFAHNESASIPDHCWIIIKNYRNRQKNLIIDITADQNGYSQKIIFKYEDDLIKQGLFYTVKSQKDPDEVNVEHLLNRLDYLERGLNKITEDE